MISKHTMHEGSCEYPWLSIFMLLHSVYLTHESALAKETVSRKPFDFLLSKIFQAKFLSNGVLLFLIQSTTTYNNPCCVCVWGGVM